MEFWKPVIGYEDRFQVSNLGRLRSSKSGKILSQTKTKKGYLTHATKIGGRCGKSVCFKIHRLVALAFIPNPDNLPEINHKDGKKSNNEVENLEWVTSKENIDHAFGTGLAYARRGCDSRSSKLTILQIEEIVSLRAAGQTLREIAKKFGVHHMQIHRVCSGESYKNRRV